MKKTMLTAYALYAPPFPEQDLTFIDPIENYKKICPGVPAIAFCISVPHAHSIAERFQNAGYKSKCIEGRTSEYDRKAAIRDLGNGNLDIIASCRAMNKVIDVPPIVSCGIFLNPTFSARIYKNQLKQISKYQEGKTAYILDFVENYKRHGTPDYLLTDTLKKRS